MFADALRQRMAGIVDLTDEQIAELQAHYALLVRWNKTLNLTRIEDVEAAVERHYCESLFLGASLPVGSFSVVDIGTGAGFPGFPVAVLRPDVSVTLVESHQRKAVFLKEAVRGMKNVRVLAKRAEDVEAEFDWAISRAVSYSDLGKALGRLAPAAKLLTGLEEPPVDLGFTWTDVSVPWGDRRFLRTGTRVVVSRET